MSYDVLLKEALDLSYNEQINLIAYLVNAIQKRSMPDVEIVKQEKKKKLEALNNLSGLFSEEERKAVDESIAAGIRIPEIIL